MLQFSQLTPAKIDVQSGIIYGVCVMSKGEAKGHNLLLDDCSIDGFLSLCSSRKDGVKVRFGKDHDAGADDINGALKNFRREGDKIVADMHLLKSDEKYNKIIEMAEKMAHEFGLSASTTADEELIGHDRYVRFTEVHSVDIVSNPAATKGLFFSQQTNNQNKHSMKNIALALGLPETATEAEIIEASKLALEAKHKMDAESKKKHEKGEKHENKCEAEYDADADADAEADDEEKAKSKKKFEAVEKTVLELSAKLKEIESNSEAAKASAHKAEIENLKLEASKDGKIIPLSDESLVKLSIPEIKDVIAKLPKNQVKLSKGFVPSADNKPLDKRSPEFKAQLAAKREEGALLLGQKMLKN
jgi:hypothetical protein